MKKLILGVMEIFRLKKVILMIFINIVLTCLTNMLTFAFFLITVKNNLLLQSIVGDEKN